MKRKMHSERRHFVLLCGGAPRWRKPLTPIRNCGGYGSLSESDCHSDRARADDAERAR